MIVYVLCHLHPSITRPPLGAAPTASSSSSCAAAAAAVNDDEGGSGTPSPPRSSDAADLVSVFTSDISLSFSSFCSFECEISECADSRE